MWGKTLLLLVFSLSAIAKEEFNVAAKDTRNEDRERQINYAGLSAQKQSIDQLTKLIKKYRGQRQEPILLLKLVELQSQSAAFQFRIAHSLAHTKQKSLDLSIYKKELQTAVKTASELIAKFPHFEDAYQAYAIRGRSYEEAGNKKAATADYLHLVKHFPDYPETTSALMSLAEFATEETNHVKAVEYLSKVEEKPDSPHYPFALYKLSWSHYNLKNIPKALNYNERHIRYYDARIKISNEANQNVLNTSELAFRENSLMDSTLFFLEGMEQKLPPYNETTALQFFRNLDNGPILGKLTARFAKLVRSHGLDSALSYWKNELLEKESKRPETLEVVMITFEHQINRRKYDQVAATSKDFVSLLKKSPELKKSTPYTAMEKLLLNTAKDLQALTIKNKLATEVNRLSSTLAVLYESFTQIVEENDPRIPLAHYNLAETLFAIREFDQATTHYRWIVEKMGWGYKPKKAKDDAGEPVNVAQASIRAVASRYEILKKNKQVSNQLTPKKFPNKDSEIPNSPVKEFITWIDTHRDKTKDPIDQFYFEANRLRYSLGEIHEATRRLDEYARKFLKSEFAIPSASLVLDTYIASDEWEKLYPIADTYSRVEAWKTDDFSKKSFVIASDTFAKMAEQSYKKEDYKDSLSRAEAFIKKYPTSERYPEVLMIAGHSALKAKDKKKAVVHFSEHIEKAPKAKSLPFALLGRAGIYEEEFDYKKAAQDLETFLKLPAAATVAKPNELKNYREKVLNYYWFSSQWGAIQDFISNSQLCFSALLETCDRFNALIHLNGKGKMDAKAIHKKTEDAPEKNQAAWTLAYLAQGRDKTQFKERNKLLRGLAKQFEKSDAMLKAVLYPDLRKWTSLALAWNRESLNEMAPLIPKEKYIAYRIELIQSIEKTATQLIPLPWASIRSDILRENAKLYFELSQGLQKLSAPKGLSDKEKAEYEEFIQKVALPFDEKGHQILNQAFELASYSGVSTSDFKDVMEVFAQANPSVAKSLKPPFSFSSRPEFKVDLLEDWDPEGKWDDIDAKSKEPALVLKAKWAMALEQKNFPLAFYLLQEAQEQKLLTPTSIALTRALTLSALGATGEALLIVGEWRKSLPTEKQTEIAWFEFNHYINTYSKKKIGELVKELATPPIQASGKQKSSLLSAAEWAKIKLSPEVALELGADLDPAREPASPKQKTK